MSLGSIRQAIINDPDNAWAKEQGFLPVYTADVRAKIMIVGQAPGRKAQTSMVPWNDVSGDRLRSWLGVSREQFYDPALFALVPMDFYYPGKGKHGDLPPRKDFAPKWHPQIVQQMPDVELVLLVGRYAQGYYLGKAAKRTLSETVQSFEEYVPKFIPLVHPSPLNFRWLKRNPWFEAQLVPLVRDKVHQIIS